MKTLIICNFSSGLLKFRGLLIKALIEQGNRVFAVVPQSIDNAEIESEKELEKLGCSLIRMPMERRGMNPLKDFKLLKSYVHTIKQEHPDMVITYTIKPNAYGGIACRLCGVPYAANITGLGTAFQSDGLLRKFVTILYKVALKKAKVVFFENIENQQIIVDAGIIRKEQAYLLNGAGVDLESFPYIPYSTDEDETRFLFIGRVMKEKGINELFSAMQKLVADGCRCSLDVLGGYEEDYKEIIEKYEGEGWLHYRGYQKDVRPYIEKCHCFVLPSWHEGMANTNLECAASGRPVITSNIHGCLEAVEDGVSGYLCKKKDCESLYERMKEFCSLPYDKRAKMGIAGRKHVENNFDKTDVVKTTIDQLMI